MTVQTSSQQPDTNRLRAILLSAAKHRQVLDYKSLAQQLGFSPPNTIQKTVILLEACQEDDALLGRPQLAATVIQKTGPRCPRPGFFQKLKELKVYEGQDRGPQAEMWHQNELEKVFDYYRSASA